MGGAAADTFTLTSTLAGVTYNLDGAGGTNTVVVNANGNYTLSNSSLSTTAAGFNSAFGLSNITVANLTGGASANTFTVSGWTGSGTITGGGGADTVSTLRITTSAGAVFGTLGLGNFEVATLSGGASANAFTVSGWTGSGTITGGGGADTVSATKDANFTLSNTALTSSDGMSLTLSSSEERRVGKECRARWSQVRNRNRTGNLDGAAGDDVINVTMMASRTVMVSCR